MSQVNMITAEPSFWEVGSYKRTVKRMNTGISRIDDLAAMLKERAACEAAYSRSLLKWQEKWQSHAEKAPEFGTLHEATDAFLQQSKSIADIHAAVNVNLIALADEDLTTYKKYAYHKDTFTGIKEVKTAEKGFHKAQKPWVKTLDNVSKARQKYHQSCTNEHKAKDAVDDASKNSQIPIERVNKLRATLEKASQDLQVNLRKYEKALADNEAYLPRYKADMTTEYMRCQDIEAARIEKLKEVELKATEIIDVSQAPGFNEQFNQLKIVVNNISSQLDLENYDVNHGVGMPTVVPAFVEWTPDMMTAPSNSSLMDKQAEASQAGSLYRTSTSVDESQHDAPSYESHEVSKGADTGALYMACYEYEALCEDELTLNDGDQIELLTEVDEHGWCTGKNISTGATGQIPANYIEKMG